MARRRRRRGACWWLQVRRADSKRCGPRRRARLLEGDGCHAARVPTERFAGGGRVEVPRAACGMRSGATSLERAAAATLTASSADASSAAGLRQRGRRRRRRARRRRRHTRAPELLAAAGEARRGACAQEWPQPQPRLRVGGEGTRPPPPRGRCVRRSPRRRASGARAASELASDSVSGAGTRPAAAAAQAQAAAAGGRRRAGANERGRRAVDELQASACPPTAPWRRARPLRLRAACVAEARAEMSRTIEASAERGGVRQRARA